MELVEISNAATVHGADCEHMLVAGQHLKTEVGEDEMSLTVPAGEEWVVRLSMKVEKHTL